MDDGGGEGGCTKSAKLVANFVVALDDEATFLALDCVFFGKRSTTAVASGGEARGFLPIADVETIPEFEGRQQRLSGSGGVHGEPVASICRQDDFPSNTIFSATDRKSVV